MCELRRSGHRRELVGGQVGKQSEARGHSERYGRSELGGDSCIAGPIELEEVVKHVVIHAAVIVTADADEGAVKREQAAQQSR